MHKKHPCALHFSDCRSATPLVVVGDGVVSGAFRDLLSLTVVRVTVMLQGAGR